MQKKFLAHNKAVFSAFISALLFGICVPCAKMIDAHIAPVMMGGLLYLGAGLGLILAKREVKFSLKKSDLPYAIAMVILDILAVISLMYGIKITTGANASLLGCFELVATSLIAYFAFKELISKKLFLAIILITIASILLSYDGAESLKFNLGSIFVLISCILWGAENNCTKMLSHNDPREVTIIKGIFAGVAGLILSYFANESIADFKWMIVALILGFFSYGISVSLYIYAQRFLGAPKTGAYFALAPFIGVLFSMLFLGEIPQLQFYIALLIMIIASLIVISDIQNS